MEWHEYKAEDDDFIDISEWGQDHWSTFAYLETRAVDAGGVIDNRKMCCNARLHREFANGMDAESCHTRLKSREAGKRDDWSCLEDMVAAGLSSGASGRLGLWGIVLHVLL